MVGNYPKLAGRIPVSEICEAMAGAGTGILRAGARRGLARGAAFAKLERRWRRVPADVAAAPVPDGPGGLRYVSYSEPHPHYDRDRPGEVVLVVATPDTEPTAPWPVASEEVEGAEGFRVSGDVFGGVADVRRDGGRLALGDDLVLEW